MVDGAYNRQATYAMSGQKVTILASTLNVDLQVLFFFFFFKKNPIIVLVGCTTLCRTYLSRNGDTCVPTASLSLRMPQCKVSPTGPPFPPAVLDAQDFQLAFPEWYIS